MYDISLYEKVLGEGGDPLDQERGFARQRFQRALELKLCEGRGRGAPGRQGELRAIRAQLQVELLSFQNGYAMT